MEMDGLAMVVDIINITLNLVVDGMNHLETLTIHGIRMEKESDLLNLRMIQIPQLALEKEQLQVTLQFDEFCRLFQSFTTISNYI